MIFNLSYTYYMCFPLLVYKEYNTITGLSIFIWRELYNLQFGWNF